jgi:hypothetical protein
VIVTEWDVRAYFRPSAKLSNKRKLNRRSASVLLGSMGSQDDSGSVHAGVTHPWPVRAGRRKAIKSVRARLHALVWTGAAIPDHELREPAEACSAARGVCRSSSTSGQSRMPPFGRMPCVLQECQVADAASAAERLLVPNMEIKARCECCRLRAWAGRATCEVRYGQPSLHRSPASLL